MDTAANNLTEKKADTLTVAVASELTNTEKVANSLTFISDYFPFEIIAKLKEKEKEFKSSRTRQCESQKEETFGRERGISDS
jgi:hypothetical protein